MKGPQLGPGGEGITWPDQGAPWSRRAPSTRKPQTSAMFLHFYLRCNPRI